MSRAADAAVRRAGLRGGFEDHKLDAGPGSRNGLLWLAAALSLILLTVPPAATAHPGGAPAPAPAPPSPRAPYLQRGDEVDGRYQAYRERLERFFEALGARLEEEAPDLRATLTPPAPVPYGYQILPVFIPDPPRLTGPRRIVSAAFSWSRTESSVERSTRSKPGSAIRPA